MFRIYESNNYPRDIIGTSFLWALSPPMEPKTLCCCFVTKSGLSAFCPQGGLNASGQKNNLDVKLKNWTCSAKQQILVENTAKPRI